MVTFLDVEIAVLMILIIGFLLLFFEIIEFKKKHKLYEHKSRRKNRNILMHPVLGPKTITGGKTRDGITYVTTLEHGKENILPIPFKPFETVVPENLTKMMLGDPDGRYIRYLGDDPASLSIKQYVQSYKTALTGALLRNTYLENEMLKWKAQQDEAQEKEIRKVGRMRKELGTTIISQDMLRKSRMPVEGGNE